MQTSAVRDGDHYVVNGEKKWNTGGAVASLNPVFVGVSLKFQAAQKPTCWYSVYCHIEKRFAAYVI